MKNTSQKRSRWGIGIFALYGGFVVFILICVAFASLQNFDLVDPDYYQKGIEYQQQIDRLNRTAAAGASPTMAFDSERNGIFIAFPSTVPADSLHGSVTLFRPSNAHWDRTIPLAVAAGHQQMIATDSLARGRWRIKVNWIVGDSSYFAEDFLDLE